MRKGFCICGILLLASLSLTAQPHRAPTFNSNAKAGTSGAGKLGDHDTGKGNDRRLDVGKGKKEGLETDKDDNGKKKGLVANKDDNSKKKHHGKKHQKGKGQEKY